MIIPAIRSILPIILKSAKFTPTSKEVDVLSRLVNRMKYLLTLRLFVRLHVEPWMNVNNHILLTQQ